MLPFIFKKKTQKAYKSYNSSYKLSYKSAYKNNNHSKPLTPRTIHAIDKYVNTLHSNEKYQTRNTPRTHDARKSAGRKI